MEEELLNAQLELEEIKIAYEEFKLNAIDKETEFQKEIQKQEAEVKQLYDQIDNYQAQIDNLKGKTNSQSTEISSLQSKILDMDKKINLYSKQKRELEILNDNFESEARQLEFWKQDLEQKLNKAEEEAIIYKEELDTIQQAKTEEIQRLQQEILEMVSEMQFIKNQGGDSKQLQRLKTGIQQRESESQRIRQSILVSNQDPIRQRSQSDYRINDNANKTVQLQTQNSLSQNNQMIVMEVPEEQLQTQESPSISSHESFQSGTLDFQEQNEQSEQDETIQKSLPEFILQPRQSLQKSTRLSQTFIFQAITQNQSIKSSNIKTNEQFFNIIRIRKQNDPNKQSFVTQIDENSVQIQLNTGVNRKFQCDGIIGEDANDDTIQNTYLHLLQNVDRGKNSILICFGEKQSGKSFSVYQMLNIAGNYWNEKAINFKMFEIHNENVKNLLNDDIANTIQDIQNWGALVNNQIELNKLIDQALERKKKKSKSQESYRVSIIYMLAVGEACFMIVDSVGSEKNFQVSSDIVKEQLLINKTLFTLEEMLSTYGSDKDQQVYRNSMLTRVIWQTLSQSQCKCALQVNINKFSVQDSLCSLSFLQRVQTFQRSVFQWEVGGFTEEVVRLLKLLQKETQDKDQCLRHIEHLERDLIAFQQGIKEKEQKITQLQTRFQKQDLALIEQQKLKQEKALIEQENTDLREVIVMQIEQIRQLKGKSESKKDRRLKVDKLILQVRENSKKGECIQLKRKSSNEKQLVQSQSVSKEQRTLVREQVDKIHASIQQKKTDSKSKK